MNKVLCKRDNVSIYGNIVFKKDYLYNYKIDYFLNDMTYQYQVIDEYGTIRTFGKNSKHIQLLNDIFYTPEETLVILRKDKIKILLSDGE